MATDEWFQSFRLIRKSEDSLRMWCPIEGSLDAGSNCLGLCHRQCTLRRAAQTDCCAAGSGVSARNRKPRWPIRAIDLVWSTFETKDVSCRVARQEADIGATLSSRKIPGKADAIMCCGWQPMGAGRRLFLHWNLAGDWHEVGEPAIAIKMPALCPACNGFEFTIRRKIK